MRVEAGAGRVAERPRIVVSPGHRAGAGADELATLIARAEDPDGAAVHGRLAVHADAAGVPREPIEGDVRRSGTVEVRIELPVALAALHRDPRALRVHANSRVVRVGREDRPVAG